jgi:glucosamine-6-phosphate deaminase
MFDYFTYDAETLKRKGQIPLTIMENGEEVFKAIASDMTATIEENNRKGEKTVFIIPVGPVGQYPFFIEQVNEKGIRLKDTYFINMDEYLDEADEFLPVNHRLSFRGFMEREVYGKIDPSLVMDTSQRIFPDPKAPGAVDALIKSLGKVDVCYGGIGITGHIAFNEPEDVDIEEFKTRPTRVLTISRETRTINSVGDLNGAVEAMPKRCVTIGIKQILSARRVVLASFRDWHRSVVRQALCEEPTAAFPVTLLQNHADAQIIIPLSVAVPAYEKMILD